MKRNLAVFLLAVILALLIPVTSALLASDPAFTSDNLVILQVKNN